MQRPEMSLIICTFNQQWLLPAVIAAAATQDFPGSYELIICDDGSSNDALRAVAGAADERSVDIRYVWQPDAGFRVGRSRNNAIRLSRGKTLVFVDGDSVAGPTLLADHSRCHSCGEKTVACGGRVTIGMPRETSSCHSIQTAVAAMASSASPEWMAQQSSFAGPKPWRACLSSNFSVPRTPDIEFDEAFTGWGSEDRDLACRLFQAGYVFKMLAQPNAVHIRPKGGATLPDPDSVVAALRSKLTLRDKWPAGEMKESLELVRHAGYDPQTDQWFVDWSVMREDSSDAILDAFETWLRRRDRCERQR
jgi:glycosyltransferase involved in cell wall biosynthesis